MSNNPDETKVMLDTFVWIRLKEDEDFQDEFAELYYDKNIYLVFSIGNFLDLVRRDHQDRLSPLIYEFADEYLGRFDMEMEEEYLRKEDPVILASMDPTYYDYCKRATRGLSDIETLKALFRDSHFTEEPTIKVIEEIVNDIRKVEEFDLDHLVKDKGDTSKAIAAKKARVFRDYVDINQNGIAELDIREIPLKKFVLGMSLIHISETYHNPEIGDYRDALIWIQSLVTSCDILWTEQRWKYEYPVIEEILDEIEDSDIKIVSNFDDFREKLTDN